MCEHYEEWLRWTRTIWFSNSDWIRTGSDFPRRQSAACRRRCTSGSSRHSGRRFHAGHAQADLGAAFVQSEMGRRGPMTRSRTPGKLRSPPIAERAAAGGPDLFCVAGWRRSIRLKLKVYKTAFFSTQEENYEPNESGVGKTAKRRRH